MIPLNHIPMKGEFLFFQYTKNLPRWIGEAKEDGKIWWKCIDSSAYCSNPHDLNNGDFRECVKNGCYHHITKEEALAIII